MISPLYSQPSGKKVVMGVPPASLLRMLPDPPENWKLLSSVGTNEISAFPALLTFAIREYRCDPPPEKPGEPAPPPQTTKITFLDTAFDPDRSFVFDSFRQGNVSRPNVKRFTVGGIPFIEKKVSETQRIVSGAFQWRFIVSMIFDNQTDEERDEWLKALNVPALNTWMKGAPRLPPTSKFFTVSRVDELNKKGNQTLRISYMTEAQRKAEEKEVPQVLDGGEEQLAPQ